MCSCVLRGWLGQGKCSQGVGHFGDWYKPEVPGIWSLWSWVGPEAAQERKRQGMNLGQLNIVMEPQEVSTESEWVASLKVRNQGDQGWNGDWEQGRVMQEVQDGSMFSAENVDSCLLIHCVLLLHSVLKHFWWLHIFHHIVVVWNP